MCIRDRDRIVLEQGGKTAIDINRSISKTTSQDEAEAQDGYRIDGLVIQKTLTKSGRDFFRMFYSDYYNRQIHSPKNIVIKEVPGRRRNTLITVEVDGTLVWQFFAQPRKEFLSNMVGVSLQRVLSLQRYANHIACLLYTSPSPRDLSTSRMPSSA